jgi:hypothetical protein
MISQFKSTEIEIYEMVLNKSLSCFPPYFWTGKEGIDAAKILVKYLLEDKLKFNDEDIKNNITAKFFKKYKLGNMLDTIFGNSPFNAINSVYPNRFHEWDFLCSKKWTKDSVSRAIKWLFEEKLCWDYEIIKFKANNRLLEKYNLSTILKLYNYNVFKILKEVYPDKDWSIIRTGRRVCLDKKKVNNIIKLYENKKITTGQIAKKYNVCQSTIVSVINQKHTLCIKGCVESD